MLAISLFIATEVNSLFNSLLFTTRTYFTANEILFFSLLLASYYCVIQFFWCRFLVKRNHLIPDQNVKPQVKQRKSFEFEENFNIQMKCIPHWLKTDFVYFIHGLKLLNVFENLDLLLK